jgi:hypothetical protein
MKVIFIAFFTIAAVTASKITLPDNPLIEVILRNHIPKQKPVKDYTPSPAINPEWIEQRVNHFDPQNTDTFNQRYFTNDEFFQEGGPIIVYLHTYPFYDGLGIVYLSFGPVHDLANEFNGVIVMPQHRYFEESGEKFEIFLNVKN